MSGSPEACSIRRSSTTYWGRTRANASIAVSGQWEQATSYPRRSKARISAKQRFSLSSTSRMRGRCSSCEVKSMYSSRRIAVLERHRQEHAGSPACALEHHDLAPKGFNRSISYEKSNAVALPCLALRREEGPADLFAYRARDPRPAVVDGDGQ